MSAAPSVLKSDESTRVQKLLRELKSLALEVDQIEAALRGIAKAVDKKQPTENVNQFNSRLQDILTRLAQEEAR